MSKTFFKNIDSKNKIWKAYDDAVKYTSYEIHTNIIHTSFGDTHLIEAGTQHKDVLVLLHGASSNASAWIADMASYSKEYRVLAIDIIGEAGKSAENRLPLDTNDYALWLKEVFDILEIHQANIIGLSQGGWLAIRFATIYPSLAKTLVLLSPAGIVPTKGDFLLKALFYSLFGQKGRKKINNIVLGKQVVDSKVHEFMDLIQTNFNARMNKEYLFTDTELSQLNMPVLVIGGQQDVIRDTSEIVNRCKARIPQISTILIPEMGHVLTGLTAPILSYLKQLNRFENNDGIA